DRLCHAEPRHATRVLMLVPLASLERIVAASQGVTLEAHQCPDYVSKTHGQTNYMHTEGKENKDDECTRRPRL
ncbi:hypothetical protein F4604DRAFT_1735725, partial [Suillus subluteus]